MAGKDKFSLSLVIKAVDKATGPLAEVNAKLARMTAPVKQLGASLGRLGTAAGLPRLATALGGVGSSVRNVGSAAAGLAAKFAGMAAAAGVGLYAVVKGAVEAGDELGEMAQRVGLGVDAFASLRYAAAQADVDQESFNGALDKFNKNLGDAKAGTGGLLSFLNKVSPTLGKQIKSAATTEEALSLMTDAMAKIQDPAKRAALASAAFGRSGLQMGVFLNQGSAAIQLQQRRYLELTGSQEGFAKGAGDLDNALRESETAFLGLRVAAATALFPAITQLSRAVTEFLTKNRAGLQKWAEKTGAAIQKWVDDDGIGKLVKGLKDTANTVSGVVDKLGGLENAAKLAALYMAGPTIAALANTTLTLGKLGLEASVVTARFVAARFATGAWIPYLWMMRSSLLTAVVVPLKAAGASIAAFGATMAPVALAIAPFAAAVGGLGLAAYQVYKNWGDLKILFNDIATGPLETMSRMVRQLREDMESLSGFGGMSGFIPGVNMAKAAVYAGNKLFGSEAPPRPMLGAAAAAGPAPVQQSTSRVEVSFENLPRGARVTQDKSQPVDLSMGYSNLVP